MLITILTFLIILSVLVLIHEAGHFIVAKLFKIRVEEFGFGIPPRAFGIKRGETLYSINWLPIGGFVKLYGEDEAGAGKISKPKSQTSITKDLSRAYFARPLWQRASIVIAGVVMNFLLAVVIISFLFSAVGVPTPGEEVSVSEVVNNSPAQTAGLKVGDRINYINDQKITSSLQLINYTKMHLGQELILKVTSKNGNNETLTLTPRKNYPKDQGPMGVAISQNTLTKKYTWYEAPIVGTKEALNESWMIISGLFSLVSQLVRGSVPTDVAGPVGIAQLTGKVVDLGPFAVLSFVSLLSLNLAIVNILPIPGLDGGRLFFIIIEAVTRRKVPQVFEGYAHTIGMVLLLILIALITIHDLIRIFTGQPIIPK